MKLNSRTTLVVALAATTMVALSACGGGTKPGQPNSSEKGFSAWGLTGGAEQTFRDSFDQWNQANSGAPVASEFFANDAYKEKVRTAVGSGNAPTLIYSWAGGTLKDYVANNNVVDLTNTTKDIQGRLVPAILDVGKVDGKVYAIPNNNTQPVVLYYNKDLFKKAGIPAAPTTYDEFLADIQKLKAAGVDTPVALAGQSQWPELMWLEYFADRIGGPEAFQAVIDGKPDAWSNPDMLKALQTIQDLVKAGAFGDKFGSVVADSNADAALLHTGKAGMLLQGAWVYGTFLTDSPDFVKNGSLGYAAFPAVAGGKGDPTNVAGNPANYWSVSASASKEQQDAAISYLNKALFDDTYVANLIKGGNVPVTSDAEDKLAGADQGDFLTFAYSMAKDAPHFELSWDQALSSGQAQALLNNLSEVFLNKQAPAESPRT